jgi:response regulator RpfG family c-di-GMP phosphodiesterase
LVVDDDEEVHLVTKILLRNLKIDGEPIELAHCYSSDEAWQWFLDHPDTAVMLLDIVMETESSGIELVRRIRTRYPEHPIRIIVRTGQPGMLNPKELVETLDINDYRTKTELSNISLYTTIVTNIRIYKRLVSLNNLIEQNHRDVSSLLKIFTNRTTKPWEEHDHNRKIALVVELLANALGVGHSQARSWGLAAGFHDLGMDKLESELVTGSNTYTPSQRKAMEHHCRLGYQVVEGIDSGQKVSHQDLESLVSRISLEHHENWDGTGYPQGFSGTDISLPARCTRCADIMISLSEPRSYRPQSQVKSGYTGEILWDQIRSMAGKELDPELVELVLQKKDQINDIITGTVQEIDRSRLS